MKVKRSEAVNLKQAPQLVREGMGHRAVIVSSRLVRKDGGLFGLLGRRVLEVTAAVDSPRQEEPVAVKGSLPRRVM